MEYSGFLADLNNERFAEKNQTYSSNLATLERFVMVMFDNDDLVVPKESAVSICLYAQGGEFFKINDH